MNPPKHKFEQKGFQASWVQTPGGERVFVALLHFKPLLVYQNGTMLIDVNGWHSASTLKALNKGLAMLGSRWVARVSDRVWGYEGTGGARDTRGGRALYLMHPDSGLEVGGWKRFLEPGINRILEEIPHT